MTAGRAAGVFVECREPEGVRLREALALDVPSLIVLPIDYSIDLAPSGELSEQTVARS